ncbi:MAG: hypothetical protein QNJ72_36885 [Pleurocapsa sp. MO_226.B13]|nr:hypothetical protein [Pleurocapsa sp. MO_226.B13]
MLNFATKSEKLKQRELGIEIILSTIAIVLITSIFLKAILDVDNNYDPGWYHLPFAARIWGILPREMFIGDEKWFEPRFDGFPLLAHFLQGFFWKITGRIQSTNLVSFLAILGYFFFLRSYFQVPLYLSAIALFSIPLVLSHASTSFVDLLGNVGTSILVMMTYSFYKKKQLPQTKELLIAFFGAAIAANTKTQLQPLVFVILIVLGIRLVWLYRKPIRSAPQLFKGLFLALLASTIIFATPVKNTVLYGNPLYPIKIEVAGIVLNHKLSPEAYEEGNRQLNWIKSVLEINAPQFWTPDQWSSDVERNRRGGFFGAYVVFNLLLLVGLTIRELILNQSLPSHNRRREAKVALATAIAMSLVPLNFPQSHELRYFMYWMICLVSLNLYLVSLPKNRQLLGRWLQPKYLGLVCTVFLTIVLVKIGNLYARPSLITLDKQVTFGVKTAFLAQIQPNEQVCLLSRHIGEDVQTAPIAALKYAFMYSSYFHPEIDFDYSIQAALNPEACGDRTIIPSDLNPPS